MADHQDWEPVILRKNKARITSAEAKKNPNNHNMVVSTSNANKQTEKTARIILDENGDECIAKKKKSYTAEFRKNMAEARKTKNLSQKQLASRLNVKQQVVGEIESGRAEWDGKLVNKIERVLGKLR